MTPQMDVEIPYSSACMEILLPSLNLSSGSDDLLQRYFLEPRRAWSEWAWVMTARLTFRFGSM